MEKKTILIIVTVIGVAALASGLGVLIWWLVTDSEYSVKELDGEGIGNVRYNAAFTRIKGVGDIFWWFYPTTAAAGAAKPLLLWLDGVTGLPPSMLANFGMVGPYDFNLNAREGTWIDDFNLLFVDAPVGTGFSVPKDESDIPQSLNGHADHLRVTLKSFYSKHKEYADSPLYIVGQSSGAPIALQLAIQLQEVDFPNNLQGIVLTNGVISPAVAVTKLGFYLEELGYIDYVGRAAIENYSNNLTNLVNQQRYPEACDQFLTLGGFVNEAAQTVAVNLGHIVEKQTTPNKRFSNDYFGQKSYLQSVSQQDMFTFMDETVAKALGIRHSSKFDAAREKVVQASRNHFMIPTVDKVEHILKNTNLTVSILNGNLDAVSNTPGQLQWVNNLQWSGQAEFTSAPRQTLFVNQLLQGYFRISDRLRFYWINASGHWVPRDSPAAAKRVFQIITGR